VGLRYIHRFSIKDWTFLHILQYVLYLPEYKTTPTPFTVFSFQDDSYTQCV